MIATAARIGVEAERLAASRTGGSDRVGVSSVMRYLWDDRRSADVWRFARAEAGGSERGSIVSGPLLAHIGETGGVLGRDARMPGTTKPRFSRSSLMMFMLAEVIAQGTSFVTSQPWSELMAVREATTEGSTAVVMVDTDNVAAGYEAFLRQDSLLAIR